MIAELCYGAYRIGQTRKGQALVALYDALIATFPTLACDAGTGVTRDAGTGVTRDAGTGVTRDASR